MKLEKEDILLYGLNYYNDEHISDSSGIILQSKLSEDELKILDCLKGNKVKVTIEGIIPILLPKEKKYLSDVIRPFRDNIKSIKKYGFSTGREYIHIETKDNDMMDMFPFEKDTMYKGMERGKEYSVEDLGL